MGEILPFIDKRISTLKELKRKIETEGLHKNQIGKVITLSREFGCEVYPLANALKEKLEALTKHDWTVFTEEAIEKTASDTVLSGNLAEDFGELNQYMESIISTLSPSWKNEQDAYREVVKTVTRIAHHGHAIIIGRGASVITRNMPHCYHFRLIGCLDFRAKRYAEKNNLSLEKAEKIVVEKDKLRKEFLSRFLGVHFDLNNFHLIINNELVSTDRAVDTIVSFLYELD